MLENALRYDIWDNDISREWAWSAQLYNDTAAGALYLLAARDFARWPQRLKAATARMEALPVLLAQSRSELDPARVAAINASTVAKQNGGIMDVAMGMLAPHESQLTPADRAR